MENFGSSMIVISLGPSCRAETLQRDRQSNRQCSERFFMVVLLSCTRSDGCVNAMERFGESLRLEKIQSIRAISKLTFLSSQQQQHVQSKRFKR